MESKFLGHGLGYWLARIVLSDSNLLSSRYFRPATPLSILELFHCFLSYDEFSSRTLRGHRWKSGRIGKCFLYRARVMYYGSAAKPYHRDGICWVALSPINFQNHCWWRRCISSFPSPLGLMFVTALGPSSSHKNILVFWWKPRDRSSA